MSKKVKTEEVEDPWVPNPVLPNPVDTSNVYKEVWSTLSKVDVSEHTEKKGSLTYLSWAWAWGTLMEHYPEAQYEIENERFFPDGSCEIGVTVTIRGMSRYMWLPVMDNRNNAILKPDARKISDNKMRCLTKCIAMWGLGHYIYAGEDLPPVDPEKESAKPKTNGVKPEPEEETGPHIAYEEFLKDCKDVVSLEKFYRDNEKELGKLKSGNKKMYADCIAAFKARKQELQEGK